MIKLHVLASGSSGNASLVEDVDTGQLILIDAGITKREFLNRAFSLSVDPKNITDILITHEHSDHIKGIGVIMRELMKLAIAPRIHTGETLMQSCDQLSELKSHGSICFETFKPCEVISAGRFNITTIPTSHDCRESFGFRFDLNAPDAPSSNSVSEDTLVYLTDTGKVTSEAMEAMSYANVLAIESNHDIQMLKNGPYPFYLKKRIGSDKGHLSNDQAATAIEDIMGSLSADGLRAIVAMHVSIKNNTYELPKRSIGSVLERYGSDCDISVGRKDEPLSV